MTLLVWVAGGGAAFGQKVLDDVLVTGQAKKIVLCGRDEDVWTYRFVVRMQAKNVGARRAIISSASPLISYYKVASSLEQLNTQGYSHHFWITSGGVQDRKSAPKQIEPPFILIAPDKSVDFDVDFRAGVIGELKPGPNYVQIVGENWPWYSDEYIPRLRAAWARHGALWAHSLNSGPISFEVPARLKKGFCP